MATRLSCCLNLPLSNPKSFQSSSETNNRTQVSWTMKGVEKARKNQYCVLGVACMVIGVIQLSYLDGTAVAKAGDDASLPVVETMKREKGKKVGLRWSDKRMCQPWRVNSLETIVPENLPRPSAPRRWEAVGLGADNAPPVGVEAKRAIKANCFSM